jgi:acyl-CoA thioester hydrolase
MTWRPSDYRCDIAPQWIDYNGHLRDAYYTLVFSQAIDALMHEVGLDDAYRASSGCTLFTLETHIHYLREVKASDAISVRARAIGVDAKRLHLGLALHCTRLTEPAAVGECMLLHVQQQPEPKSATFPFAILQRLTSWQAADQQLPALAPGSRRMELPRR